MATTETEYVAGQGPRWTPRAGLAVLSDAHRARLPMLIAEAEFAMLCDEDWLVNRLTVLWLHAGYRKGEAQATAWLGETVRLLSEVPTDILADAIDEAVKRSERGFLPAVGEILKIADPAVEKRRLALRRMRSLAEEAGKPQPATAPDEEICSPDVAQQIIDEMNLRTEAKPKVILHDRPARKPTRADYLALGVSAADLDRMGVGTQPAMDAAA